MKGRDISLRPAPLDEFFSVVMAGQYFFFQIFFNKVRAIIFAFHLPGKWSSFSIITPAAVVAAPFKILLAKQHRRFLFTCKCKRRNSANGSLGM